jgi:hypothetical protein
VVPIRISIPSKSEVRNSFIEVLVYRVRAALKQRKAHFESEWKLQAVRTSWRIVKDWTEAQMALVETQMVTTAQVFLPYAVMRDGRTLGETVAQDPKFLLGGGDEH